MNWLINYFKSVGLKRVIAMIIGNTILALGISIFKYAGMGNDPFTAMALSSAEVVGLPYPVFLMFINLGFFIIEFLYGKKYIGIGSLFNAFVIGYIISFFINIWDKYLPHPESFFAQLPIMIVGVIVTSLGVSFYQTSDAGVAPFDSLSIIMTERFKKIPYFWNRMFTDAFCAIVTWFCGGLLGLGTLACAFCLGPVVHFFNKTVSEKIINNN